MARSYGILRRSGRVKHYFTPKVDKKPKNRPKIGRAKKRRDYNKRFRLSNCTIKQILQNPMASFAVKAHAPIDRLNIRNDKVKYVPPPIRETYIYDPVFDPSPSKFNKGVHTIHRERERRIFQRDLNEFQLSGRTSLMSQWGNSDPIVHKPSDSGSWMHLRSVIRFPHLPYGTIAIEPNNTLVVHPRWSTKASRRRSTRITPKNIYFGPAMIAYKDGIQVFE